MSYVIAFVIIIVAAGALLLFRQPVEAPASTTSATAPEAEVAAQDTTETTTSPAPAEESDQATLEADAAATIDTPAIEEIIPEISSASYEAEASYLTPKRTEHDIVVMLELEGTTIVDANVTYDGGAPATASHSGFDSAYAAEVIGADINEVSLSRVGGASLTSDAFNEAVADIKAQL